MARRNSLKNKFDDMSLDEPLKVEIDGRELELEVFAQDVSTFMLIGQQDDEVEQRHLDNLEETLRKILQRSYLPYYNVAGDYEMEDLSADQEEEQREEKQFIEGLLTRYYIDLFTGITEALGWHDGDIDASGLQSKKKETEEKEKTRNS